MKHTEEEVAVAKLFMTLAERFGETPSRVPQGVAAMSEVDRV